ncbi:UDP-N-acetylmuramoyl-L-alanyl-D-glutamate--2,6-diaminopimelate ligase [Alkalilimnicola ehrlichii MLHE-1]|uniref:UDP-N-acetylmuramoyl-L-alanyl-D-glutamate--2,6-diaminopimelate ligase n=1 Tax=Alkalilimnicola ehrlichii (strain ATCC BAA-1101 / DSM 17681 / MLHE-1) TaxID=187272 RepID=MURE_ALKEH|nr:UDP-N-acetylmuramoyl-L-alanyl-D-glutamate--2,6-diaminopimelate ligase [Alkalilimnicola ehrlichii]Q0A6J7.1 RecName: Full=UDP-N-acetylmuramoyl-L-alanyl-D-glutamate--2,6-diaminopimelate ligase; AltName: Full=Meso-A2pm-adding enzyme; AltName: Full=Meso-diaminopimelate-adding enzyme; AltName: Full=UDP-MurNAc-L-Ala-D-Glu:meso-diaminopimelate ligase; AltName: Full=UDP-MurNAc-tripeptide synthetase; AltName: Full=UDP-N-acetylmuramyl-tripeptide synthetase [Alkalilimnicola ehrlichii MLHE-1]ABI57540.1 UDP
MMRLRTLLQPWLDLTDADDRPVGGLAVDSRDIEPGFVFVALRGSRHHGLGYLGDALAAGAGAVLWEPAGDVAPEPDERTAAERAGVPLIAVPDLGRRLGPIAARLYGDPSARMRVVGVTGTDGKTSVTQYLAQLLDREAHRCGLVGTLGSGFPDSLQPGTHTTPDAASVQRTLARLHRQGAAQVAMEVSSHALDQHRVAGVRFHTAVLTNLGRDHLDYHGDLAGYAEAKSRLFGVPGLQWAVLNLDDAFGRQVHGALAGGTRALGYSLAGHPQAGVRGEGLVLEPQGLRLRLSTEWGEAPVQAPLLGAFNAANVLAVAAAALSLGVALPVIVERLAGLRPVPGRMEPFTRPGRPSVIVDYAHTPAALRGALAAVRAHYRGAVWLVFGCGGDRDRGKRPLMGEAAAELADRVVLTDDNPRREDPDRIIDDIRQGAPGRDWPVLRDRAGAIRHAVERAGPEDVVLVAGKGHETVQQIGDRCLPFSDREAVVQALGEEEGA